MWFSDFQLVLPDRTIARGSLRVEAGRIAEISDTPVPGGIAGDGLMLMPGFIDMHGDMIEQELEPRPRVDMPMEYALHQLDNRLASSGVTTAYASVSFSAGASKGARRSFDHTSSVIRALHGARHTLRVDHRIHARFDITFDNALDIIEGLIRDDTLDLVSLMDHTPGQGQYRNLERFVGQIAYMQGVSQEEARRIVDQKITDRTRPAQIITKTLAQVSTLCREHGVAIASHDDDTPDKVALMHELGAAISEFPVTMEAARAAHAHGLAIAMGAPNALRGQSYSGNLSARDAHGAGLLGILAADYHPGTLLPAVLALAPGDADGLPGAVRLVTANPARALGLGDRGTLQPGKRADLAVADPAHGGRVVAAISAGRVIFSDGRLVPVAALAEGAAA